MKNWRELKPHKLNVYPPMQDWEFQELKESILKKAALLEKNQNKKNLDEYKRKNKRIEK